MRLLYVIVMDIESVIINFDELINISFNLYDF